MGIFIFIWRFEEMTNNKKDAELGEEDKTRRKIEAN